MRFCILAFCLLFIVGVFVHTEEFQGLKEAEAHIVVWPSPTPEELFKSPDKQEVKITAYTPDPKENWGNDSKTAFGTKLTVGTIAVSRDLYKRGWKKGRKVYVKSLGVFKVNDLMHKRHKNKIDILMLCKKTACDFGIQTGKAILLSEGY